MWELFLDVVFPRTCLSCGKFGLFLCTECRNQVELYDRQLCPYCKEYSDLGLTHKQCKDKLGLDGLYVWAHYSGPIPKVVKAIKYHGVYAAVGEVAALMMNSYDNKFDFDYLVPVPLSQKRERERGFNQADKLAQEIRQGLKKKNVLKDFSLAPVIKRDRDTKPQFDLGVEERKTNLEDAFTLQTNTGTLSPFSFCLIDDVATTGTTLFECARVLKKAGAKKVYGIAIASGG